MNLENFADLSVELTAPTLPTGPRGLMLLKLGSLIQSEPLETYRFIHHKYGDIVYAPFPNRPCIFLFDPNSIAHVLKHNHTNYLKSREYESMKPLLGEGLLTSEGEHWKKMRKIMVKEFHVSKVNEFVPVINLKSELKFESLSVEKEVDLSKIFMNLTLELACEMFFGIKNTGDQKIVEKVLSFETKRISKNVRSAFNFPYYVPTLAHLKSRTLICELDKMVDEIIENGSDEINVLSKLLTSRDNLEVKHIRDEIVTLMLAGHETTSNALTWTLYNLIKKPEWIELIRSELKEQNPKTLSDYENCKSLKAVFLESLRLFPPAPLISRMAKQDDIIEEKIIPAGATVIISPYVTHRDPRYWDNADEFQPERFIGRENKRNDFSYFPFARGARSCIGEHLAMAEGLIILANFVMKFDFKLKEGFDPKPEQHITLQAMNGLKVSLTKVL